jgi:hypothetical protein
MMIAFVALLLAVNLGRYIDWPHSPQGYFMTRAERAEWSTLRSESDAARFVARFVASRGPGFAEKVAAAANAADDNLTVGRTRGSRSLRGRIVILLGPPAAFTIDQHKSGGVKPEYVRGLQPWRSHDVTVTPDTPGPQSELRTKFPVDYIFTYGKRTIAVAVNPITGDDRILDARAAREVDALLEAAAEARAAVRQ